MENMPYGQSRKGIPSLQSSEAKKGGGRYFSVNVLPDDLWLRVREGESLWKALQDADIKLGECAGLGKCGKCKIKLISSIGAPSDEEKELLDETEIQEGTRLACRITIHKDLVVYIGEPEVEEGYPQILKTGYRRGFSIDPLLTQRPITISWDDRDEALSVFQQVKHALGPNYETATCSLHGLRSLAEVLGENPFCGTAVLHDSQMITLQRLEEIRSLYGLVFDIGTTTLVGKLINLTDGIEVAVVSCLNGQSTFGADVVSRHQYVKEHPDGLNNLCEVLIDNLNHITARLLKRASVKPDDVLVVVAAGNTTMQHLLLKLDPSGIAEAPFIPLATEGLILRASDIGLHVNPEALFYMLPAKSGYIGGDHIAVIVASGAAEQEDKIVLGMDFGTNAEIFLGNRRRMMTCSTAAGPALEGANISRGMIAGAGAIEAVCFEQGDLYYQIIGNVKPKGICGSGLVELVAVLLELGIIDSDGLIRHPQVEAARHLGQRVIENESGVNAFLIASVEESYDGKPVYLTQKDVRQLQLAKGAVAAGVKTLMEEMGIGIEDLGQVYLAGALGNYVNPNSAMQIGLIPKVDQRIISSLGNASSSGASMVLLSKDHWHKAKDIASFIEHIELSSRLDFNDYFVEQMDFAMASLLDFRSEEIEKDIMKTIKVAEVMTSDFPTVSSSASVEELSERLRDTGHHGLPVMNEEGRLLGCATLVDLAKAARSGKTDLSVGDIATKELFVAYPDQTLYEVLQATSRDYGRIPVVERHDRHHLIGVLRRHDIVKAYRKGAALR